MYKEKLESVRYLLNSKQVGYEEEIDEWHKQKLQQASRESRNNYGIYVLDAVAGLIALTMGNEWSIVSIRRLLEWLETREEKETNDFVEENATDPASEREGLQQAMKQEMSPWSEEASTDATPLSA
jgi:hypothetical protein